MIKYELYEVGGKIRDELLGLKSNDVDYSVVLIDYTKPIDQAFDDFVKSISEEGFKVFLETPDCFTVRAQFPKHHKYSGVADFVLAREEKYYPECGRKPVSKLGTLEDDLIRRDFTVNAMARGDGGQILDPFGGYMDLMNGILKTPKNAAESFKDDPLRILRAMRFSITKDLNLSDGIIATIYSFNCDRMKVVSTERIREELYKCFKHDTKATLKFLRFLHSINSELHDTLIPNSIWFEPTMKK